MRKWFLYGGSIFDVSCSCIMFYRILAKPIKDFTNAVYFRRFPKVRIAAFLKNNT